MKIVSPFEPLSFWAQGPWVFFNLGLKFMQTWQEECFSRLRLTSVAAKPAARADLKLNAAASDREILGAIAARQGREAPLLGCLQNAKVVGGPESVTVSPKAIVVEPAAKPAPTPVVKAAPAKPQAVAAVAPVATPTAPLFSEQEAPLASAAPVEGAAAPSVTSMLAMQAKSLAKAVKTAPPPAPTGKANGKAAKPTAKVAAQATAKAAVKPAAKAKPAAKTKPVASKKA